MPTARLARLSRHTGARVLRMHCLTVADREGAIARMVAALAGAGLVRDPAVLERVLLAGQSFGDELEAPGVAFVHCRSAMVEGLVILLAVIDQPFWDTVSGRDVDEVFMVLGDEGSLAAYARAVVELAQLARERRSPAAFECDRQP